jgi:outer membrane lipoprotein-sorting protein
MNCTHVRRNLKAFVDDELGRLARASVARHLARCEACRAGAEAVRAMSRDISKLGAPEQSNGMREAVLAAARDGRSSPTRAMGRRVRAVLLAAGGAGVLVAAALFLLFRPTPAQAALQRVIAASEAVKTCHMELLLGQPDGPQERRVLWYEEGKFRMEEWRNGKLQEIQVYRDGRMDTYLADTNEFFTAATDRPFAKDFEGFTVAALIRAGSADAQVECESVRGPDGRELNRLTITEEGMEREVVLADPATDLPVSLELYGPLDSGWEKSGGSEVIEYNVALDPELFVLNPPEGATVVDRDALKVEWQQRFDAGMVRVKDDDQEAVLRDFQVTTEGDVFVIWTAGSSSVNHSASLRDSLGTTYLDAGDRGYLQTKGWPCAWFIPVTPPAHRPATYVLTVTNGHHTYAFRVNKPIFSGSPDPVYPGFKVERGAPAFLFPWGVYGEIERAEIRAAYWKSQGDARKALQYYERQVALSDEEVHRFYVPATTWLDIGMLYEQTGQRAKAHDAYQRGLEVHRRDENRNNEWEQGIAQKLEQGLRRTR